MSREKVLLNDMRKFAKHNNISWDDTVDVYKIARMPEQYTLHQVQPEEVYPFISTTGEHREADNVTMEAETSATPTDLGRVWDDNIKEWKDED